MFRDENGEPQFIRGTSQDITRLRQSEKRLTELNHAFEQAEEMANMGNWKWMSKTETFIFSNNLYKMLGCIPGEFAPSLANFLKFIHPNDKEKALHEQDAVLKQNKSMSSEYRIIRKDGQERFIKSISKTFTNAEEGNIILGTVQDATEEIQLRRLLEEKMSFAEMLIDNSVDLIVAYDADQCVIAWNKTCEERYNLKKQDVMGKHVLVIFPELEGSLCLDDLRRALQGEFRYQPELHLELLNGYFEYYFIPLQNANGKVFGALSISHDLTEFKHTADRLYQLNHSLEQKNQELERSNDELASFSYAASHDLQEPLRKIQTFSNLIIEKNEAVLSERGKDYLKRIESASQRMQLLIDDLLTFSRTTTYPKNFALADLNVILEEVKRELKDSIEEKNVIIESATLPVARVVAFQFRQLLENLIFNSIKYSKPAVSPFIRITSEMVPGSGIYSTGAVAERPYYKLSIIDNGIGFEQKYAHRIFELFQRLHGKNDYPGTGLGLAICKKIVQNHYGFIEAYGELELGANFTIYFPVDL